MFYSSLHFAIVNSSYWNINLKPKQVQCLEAIYFGRDTIGVLPTGYGKSIIFHLLLGLAFLGQNQLSIEQSDRITDPSRDCCHFTVELFDKRSDQKKY